MKNKILCLLLLVLALNTKVYVEDYNFIEHFRENEICVSIFDKLDIIMSIHGVKFYMN